MADLTFIKIALTMIIVLLLCIMSKTGSQVEGLSNSRQVRHSPSTLFDMLAR